MKAECNNPAATFLICICIIIEFKELMKQSKTYSKFLTVILLSRNMMKSIESTLAPSKFLISLGVYSLSKQKHLKSVE